MFTIASSLAVELVRKNLDELDPNGNASVMYVDEDTDNESMTNIIERFLPEAINAVHKVAPVSLLEGVEHVYAEGDAVTISGDGVLSVYIAEGSRFLRLVAFRAADSDIVVTDVIPEASPEGRKQLNRYIRGRADRPRLVAAHGISGGTMLRYYSLADVAPYTDVETGQTLFGDDGRPIVLPQFSYVKEQEYIPASQLVPDPEYPVSLRLCQNVIDYLTGLVMETYNDQRAQSYYSKANSFPLQ